MPLSIQIHPYTYFYPLFTCGVSFHLCVLSVPPKPWTPLPRSLPSSLVSKKRITTCGTETFELCSERIGSQSIPSRSSPRLTKTTSYHDPNGTDKAIEAADMMTPTITAGIQAKPIEDVFNDRYKMYQRLKELLQPTGETQFMRLRRECSLEPSAKRIITACIDEPGISYPPR